MKKIDQQINDPLLKDLIKLNLPPELPGGFSREVMNSIRMSDNPRLTQVFNIPIWIKLGIPLFLLACCLLLILFPGEQPGIFDSISSAFSNSGFVDVFDRISLKLQSFQSPEMKISRNLGAYIIGGIGLMWMFILAERLSSRSSRS